MIQFQAVRKCFGDFVALESLSCDIPAGATVGLIGPNGAGKTTTMRILTTLTQPTQGQVLVQKQVAHDNPYKVRKLVGFMPDTFGVYIGITASEYLDFYAQCQKIEPQRRPNHVMGLLDMVGLSDKMHTDVKQLSRGMQQRLSLARALIHDPQILVLDEPASGLDPTARIELRSLINELHHHGKTILISSHILSDLADMCTHIMILQQGRLVRYDTIDNLLAMVHDQRIIVKTLHEHPAMESTAQSHGYHCVPHSDIAHCYILTGSHREADQGLLLQALIQAGVGVYDFSPEKRSLEHVFTQLTTDV